jgi:hypothetical protein
MNRRFALSAVGCLSVGAILFPLHFALAAEATTELEILEKASIRALEWFRAMAAPLTEIVTAEERTQLLEALSDLSKDLYAIEQDKLVFIQLLKRDKLDKKAITSRTSNLMQSIENARQSLQKVGPLLRQRYQLGGVEVEALLSEAAIKRKIWVNQLYDAPDDIAQRQDVIAEGEKALAALREANTELAKLIARL